MPTKINILSQVKGMSNKTPCIVATTGDTSFSTISTIDGIILTNNDRVLVWKQSNATQNGIYIFSGGTLTRALDSNAPDDFIQGMQILVISGDTYGKTLFYQTSVVSTIGSSNINFGMFGGLNGTSGTTGTTGSSGESGTNGTSGTSGTSGSSGTSGTSGTSGSSGTSGTSGTSPASQISGSGTSGYLAKFTGTTNLGNSIIYDDGTNVGIGNTATGGYKLDVSGTLRATGAATFSSSVTAVSLRSVDPSNSFSATFGANSSTPNWVAVGTIGGVPSINGYNNAFSATANLALQPNGGNVGIGTTSPTSRFQSNNSSTYNSTTPSGSIIASNLSSGNAIIDIGVDSSFLGYIQSRNILNTTFYNLLLNPIGGNVGIGTTSPNSKLHIKGPLNIERTNTTDYSIIDNEGNLNIKAATGGAGGNFNTVFFTNGTEKMRLNTDGNLGLGVTPSAWSLGRAFEVGNVGNGFWNYGVSNTNIVTNTIWNLGRKYASNGAATMYAQNNGSHEWLTAPSGTAGSAITFTQAMTLNASGNLSIGNTNNTYKLDVSGTGRFTGALTASSGEFISGGQDGSLGSVVRISTTSGNANSRNWAIVNTWDNFGDLTFRVSNALGGNALSNGTSRMVILSSGNVGIGTTSPGNFNGMSFSAPITDLVTSLNIRGRAVDGVSIINIGGETYRKASIYTSIEDQDPYLGFATSSSGISSSVTERMRIHANGGLKFIPQAAAPTAEAGTVYYDSGTNKLKVYNGTTWVDLH